MRMRNVMGKSGRLLKGHRKRGVMLEHLSLLIMGVKRW